MEVFVGRIVNPLQPDAAIMPLSRRGILEAGTSILTATIGLAGTAILPGTTRAAEPPRSGHSSRQLAAFQVRQDAAQAYRDAWVPVPISNGDEERYADKRASFAKTLPHNDAGEVDAKAFAVFIRTLTDAKAEGFETIPRDRSSETELNNPQATYAFDLVGLDNAATVLDPPPTFASAAMASDMAEVYWLSLTRDVPFREYDRNPLVGAAVSDLNAFAEPLRSGSGEKLTAATIFRGEIQGDLIGPYLSQLLWLDIPYGIKTIEQRYTGPTRGQSFLTEYREWLACQRGAKPHSSTSLDSAPRFICSARELSEYVHRDFSFQAYMNAALIMLALGKEAL
jgi:hypothetical protein